MTVKQFEITGNCNLRCEFCYNHSLIRKISEIEEDVVIGNVSKGDVVFIGGGEPMLYKRIESLAKRLVDVPTEVVIATNGTIYKDMPPEVQVQVSLVTLNPVLYEEITQGNRGNIEIVKRNIEKFLDNGNPVLVNMPVYYRNVGEIRPVSDYCDRIRVPLRISPIYPANGLSVSKELTERIEKTTLDLKLQGRDIIYSRTKQPVRRYYA